MTTMDANYRYTGTLDPERIRALARLSDVYGIRALRIDEAAHAIAIEYDATRLGEPQVRTLVQGCGVALAETAAPA